MVSTRAQVITKRTYNRPNEDGTYETWPETVDRVTMHQRWLWERAQNHPLKPDQEAELSEFRSLLLNRKISPSGRTLWLGGTETATRREASQFNCSFGRIETVHDAVDALWLLLQGCGVGFTPVRGALNGFPQRIPNIEVIRSTRTTKGGDEENRETFKDGVWTIRVGDSGEAWAKALGKLLAGKYPAQRLVFDLSQIRPGGTRLKGYGWISSGDEQLALALPKIAAILNRRVDRLLTRMDIHDILNWFGVIQTGRRGAEISLMPFGDPEWREFSTAKKNYWPENKQREQSNNSLMFWDKPVNIRSLLDDMVSNGGSEPGLINASAALERAPYFRGVNPCAEILLGNKSFCNLVEVDVAGFDSFERLERAVYIAARANYRQSCVNLDDGVLQRGWHETNEFLHLCGVGLTGIVRRPDFGRAHFVALRHWARNGACGMAVELGRPSPKNVTTIKPSGTLSKAVFDTTEGCHRPGGKYMFNNIKFSKHDPMCDTLERAGYRVFDDPIGTDSRIVTFPVEWPDVQFTDGVNRETAVEQLERYKMLMESYVDHNCSITVSYSPEEISEVASWLDRNWDLYVGVSFMPRVDPLMKPEDVGYPYLPQQVVPQEEYDRYRGKLFPVDLEKPTGIYDIDVEDCEGGMCPVK